ncbi:MAG: DUF2783 domain-containing protein [Alphaproteobacteria bacterium]|nr:DUF2783 domain-containing protein [Alphaproteobacteria bacterium]
MTLDRPGVEDVYTTLADAIDAVDPCHAKLFLAKLALLLAHNCGDVEAVKNAVAIASRDLEAHPASGLRLPATREDGFAR